MLKALDIVPDESMDLSLIIEAHMPGETWYSCYSIMTKYSTCYFMIKLNLDRKKYNIVL